MRRVVLCGSALLLGVAGLVEFAGCNASFDICEGSACGSSDGGGDDGQVLPQGCDPSKDPKDSIACVDDSIGIFVSASGSDSNAGTKSSPLKTIGAAVGKLTSQHNRVYVCDGTYAETVKLTGPANIFGGFACADWSYAGTLPKVGPATSGYALDVESVSGAVVVEDLELDAPSGQAPGESSIAVFVTQSTNVLLRRVTAKSGDGAPGADAVATSNWDEDAGAAPKGNDVDAAVSAGNVGGAPCLSVCVNGQASTGGAGGNVAAAGADGGPNIPENPTGQIPKHNGIGSTCGVTFPGPGADGFPADGGTAGAAKSGTLASSGWQVELATSGATGGIGQGGGGGGGGAGPTNGAGGGGGCGGCGGAGGAGGGSGGSSFAILGFQSTVTADACTFQAGGGGVGKTGGSAQFGQAGGFAGAAIPPGSGGDGCNGAPGGTGGAGAGGGGGAGGNAIAIGYVGTKPTVTGGSMQEGNAGTHGAGGTGAAGNDGLPGADGIKADIQELQ